MLGPWPIAGLRAGGAPLEPLLVLEDRDLREREAAALAGGTSGILHDRTGWTVGTGEAGPVGTFTGAGTFQFDVAAGCLRATPPPADPALWAHHLLGWALPLLVSSHGGAVLHAATVPTPGGALVLCGPSGRGKTTTSLALAMTAESGILSDDTTVLTVEGDGPPLAWPGPLGSRVIDGPGVKRVVHADAVGASPEPVRALVFLEPRAAAWSCRELDGPEAVVTALGSLIAADGTARNAAFAVLAAVLRRVPALSVVMPDDLDGLPHAVDELLRVTG